MNLSEARIGVSLRVTGFTGAQALRKRFIEMGIAPGTRLRVQRVAPLGDPIVVAAGDLRISMRRRDAAHITVEVAA